MPRFSPMGKSLQSAGRMTERSEAAVKMLRELADHCENMKATSWLVRSAEFIEDMLGKHLQSISNGEEFLVSNKQWTWIVKLYLRHVHVEDIDKVVREVIEQEHDLI